jgi:hypothetical protein
LASPLPYGRNWQGIALAIEVCPSEEDLTILTDSLSAVRLLQSMQRKDFPLLLYRHGKLHFFPEICLGKWKNLRISQISLPDFPDFDCIFPNNAISFFLSEVDSESLSTLRNIIFKRGASRVEGYVTPCCPEMRLSVRNLSKFGKGWEKVEKNLRKVEKSSGEKLRKNWGKVEKTLRKSWAGKKMGNIWGKIDKYLRKVEKKRVYLMACFWTGSISSEDVERC